MRNKFKKTKLEDIATYTEPILATATRRTIPGVRKDYTVDAAGNVYHNDCLMGGHLIRGYRHVSVVCTDGIRRRIAVHRLVALAWVSGRDEEAGRDVVDHIDGDKLNNRAENLRWVTMSENTKLAHHEQCLMGYTPQPCIAINLDTGQTVKFRSIADAVTYTGANEWHVHSLVKNYACDEGRKSSNGWLFMSIEDYVDYINEED